MTGALHIDVAGYVAETLTPDERRAFEAHLQTCASCRRELEELAPVGDLLRAAGPSVPRLPPGLRGRILAAVDQEAAASARSLPARRLRQWRIPALAGALAAAGALVLAMLVRQDAPPNPPVEAVAELRAPRAAATVTLVKTGIGRVVALRTDDLPILPKGDYYEIWFVGPRDRPGRPDRISGGTFHPDRQGRSHVTFAAAVDPAGYGRMAITAEPGDGDPAPTRPDVMTGPVRLR